MTLNILSRDDFTVCETVVDIQSPRFSVHGSWFYKIPNRPSHRVLVRHYSTDSNIIRLLIL